MRSLHVLRKSRLGAILAALLLLNGCMTWRATPVSVSAPTPTPTEPVRITLASGERVDLTKVEMSEDSLRGTYLRVPHRHLAVPLTEVRTVQVRRVEPVRSAIAAVAGGVVAAGVLISLFGLLVYSGEAS